MIRAFLRGFLQARRYRLRRYADPQLQRACAAGERIRLRCWV